MLTYHSFILLAIDKLMPTRKSKVTGLNWGPEDLAAYCTEGAKWPHSKLFFGSIEV